MVGKTDARASTLPVDITPYLRRIFQTVNDIMREPFDGVSIADLGCAHGGYANEFARRGARVLGIDGRATWVDRANQAKNAAKLSSEFHLDDVRNFTKSKYGSFDVVLCLGLLYHMHADDLLPLLRSIYEACDRITVVQTLVAIRDYARVILDGREYWGTWVPEHSPEASKETRERSLGSSIGNERAFWLTRASLLNMLRHVGFTSVLECANPIANVYSDGQMKLVEENIALVAFKGNPVGSFLGMTDDRPEEDWPEDPELTSAILIARTAAALGRSTVSE